MIRYTKKEEIWNSASHGGGILLGVVFGIIFLVWCFQADNNWARVGVILYLFGMLGSYVASTLYHSMKHHSKWKERLRRWDHAAIYWHIAGSYSPLTLVALRQQFFKRFHILVDALNRLGVGDALAPDERLSEQSVVVIDGRVKSYLTLRLLDDM